MKQFHFLETLIQVMKLAVSLLARTTNIPPVFFQDVENILLSMIVIFLSRLPIFPLKFKFKSLINFQF